MTWTTSPLPILNNLVHIFDYPKKGKPFFGQFAVRGSFAFIKQYELSDMALPNLGQSINFSLFFAFDLIGRKNIDYATGKENFYEIPFDIYFVGLRMF